jgi:hypothetical protein
VTGRILDRTALLDLTAARSVYGAAFLVAAVERDLELIAPVTALLDAWSAVPASDRVLLELLLDSPALRVEPLEATTATDAGVRAYDAHRSGASWDAAAAHTVDAARRYGHAVLTSDPTPLRTIDPAVGIEELPDI